MVANAKVALRTTIAMIVAFVGLPLVAATDADAQCTLPYTLTNGQTADATQLMADLNALANCLGPGGSTNAIQYNDSGHPGGVGPLANGQLVIGSTAGPPQAQALTAGPGISITNGPGNITIAATGSGGGGIQHVAARPTPTPTTGSISLRTRTGRGGSGPTRTTPIAD
jgi:hypothetical protein